jgi:feruloyl esterase
MVRRCEGAMVGGPQVRWCIVAVLLAVASAGEAATCAELSSLTLSNGVVTTAQLVAAGAFPPPTGRGGAPATNNPYQALAEFCRVAATLKPTPQSDIKTEVWLPAAGWNGKLQVVGNGAFAGTISYPAMANALAAGYAAASTDTGHTGPAANTFAHEAIVIDFAHRAIHETTAAAKQAVRAFYGDAPKFAYFNGCSTGGRQALTAAQRYPDDFDGIVAGAPAIYGSKQVFAQIWTYQATADAASALPRPALELLHAKVLESCDRLDGAADGVLEQPTACRFDPAVLTCQANSPPGSCLTPGQVRAVSRIYNGPSDARTGASIFTGLERGSELGWSPQPVGYAVDFFKYRVFKDLNWDPKALNFGTHLALAETPENRLFDAVDPDMSAFTRRGGKLLMYHGWSDPGIPPGYLVRYYGEVQAKTANAADAVKLFMVPGMGHCGGGDGASTFDMVAALDRWIMTKQPPSAIPAARVRDGQPGRTRPLCPYPQFAVYDGKGNVEEAASFACRLQ